MNSTKFDKLRRAAGTPYTRDHSSSTEPRFGHAERDRTLQHAVVNSLFPGYPASSSEWIVAEPCEPVHKQLDHLLPFSDHRNSATIDTLYLPYTARQTDQTPIYNYCQSPQGDILAFPVDITTHASSYYGPTTVDTSSVDLAVPKQCSIIAAPDNSPSLRGLTPSIPAIPVLDGFGATPHLHGKAALNHVAELGNKDNDVPAGPCRKTWVVRRLVRISQHRLLTSYITYYIVRVKEGSLLETIAVFHIYHQRLGA